MAQKVGKIAKEKKPFDKTYIPLVLAFILLVLLVGGLIYAIIIKPKDKPKITDTNTIQIEDVVVDNKNTVCSNDEIRELTEKAKKIEASYEEVEDYVFSSQENANAVDENGNVPIEEVKGYVLNVIIYGGDKDLHLSIINNKDNDIQELDFKEGIDGRSWIVEDTRFIRKYNIKVYANTESCKDVLIREFEFSIPKWNEMSKWPLCNDPIMADEKECKHFIMEDRKMDDSFDHFYEVYDKKEKEAKKKEQEQEEKGVIKYVKKYIILIIIVVVLIISGIVVFIVMKGRKRNEKSN